jgi:pantoate--beta-alanine ligase
MKIIRSLRTMTQWSQVQHRRGDTIGLVPTMGALHAGHLSLIQRAHRKKSRVVVSIFVNPLQFGPHEDLLKYPRTFPSDAQACRSHGVDVIFYPTVASLYPPGFKTAVKVLEVSDILCGAHRPGHFQGVATVVAKLFNIVQPDIAYFGQKDAQQAWILQRMVADLNIPVSIRTVPTVRETTGLAMSSRNRYLSAEEKDLALFLYQALRVGARLIQGGERHSARVVKKIMDFLKAKKHIAIQYIALVDPIEFKPVSYITGRVCIALAAWIGKTRLIDNIIVSPLR